MPIIQASGTIRTSKIPASTALITYATAPKAFADSQDAPGIPQARAKWVGSKKKKQYNQNWDRI